MLKTVKYSFAGRKSIFFLFLNYVFHIVSSLMCLYIRIITYCLFLSHLIYLWFCFQSVILSQKLLWNSNLLSNASCFFSKDQILIFWNSFLFFKKILVFTWKSWFFPKQRTVLSDVNFSLFSFFVPIIFRNRMYIILLYYNI